MRKVIVLDRANLSELFEPLHKFSGCYDEPYAYVNEDMLSSWPDVAQKLLYYILFCCLV